jgi:hypothetical protein
MRQHHRRSALPRAAGGRGTRISRRHGRPSPSSPSARPAQGVVHRAGHLAVAAGMLGLCIGYLIPHRRRRLGKQSAGRLGIRHRQLRLLGRHRPRRHAHQRHPVSLPPELAHGINRFAEAMTIFAVVCAGMFPGIHVGRPWLAYWLVPDSQPDGDVAAIPLAAAVGRLRGRHLCDGVAAVLVRRHGAGPRDLPRPVQGPIKQIVYGIFALGWNGSSRHWHRYERAYLLLAALATPLVLSVHSVVSFDFATAQLPGWHTTIFPPYFVAGAIYGGFAMVLCLAIPPANCSGSRTSSPSATWTTWARSCWPPA